MPSVQGILETAIYASDVKRDAVFYQRLFGFTPLLESDRLIALDVVGRSVLLVFQESATSEPFVTPGGSIPPHTGMPGGHFAFSITAVEFDLWRQKLDAESVTIESIVNWPTGAKSLYFRDPSRNLVELITPGFWRTY